LCRTRAPALETCPLLENLACAWVGVAEVEEAARLLVEAVGLHLLDAGQRWVLLGEPGASSGMVCLVDDRIRPSGGGLPRGWDSVEIVVADVNTAAERLEGRPGVARVWGPRDVDLSALGSNVHRSAVWRMPWGTHLILTMGITQPANRSFPSASPGGGRVFEVHLRTDRFDRALDLYAKALQMPVLMHMRGSHGPIQEAWGLPAGTPVTMSLLKSGGAGTGGGAVELQGHAGASLQSRIAGTAGGTCMVTFASADLAAVHQAVREAGFRILREPSLRAHGPFTGRQSFVVAGVEQERLEFIETVQAEVPPRTGGTRLD
jgi:catechol 2,3-dioxygenase-like lactoylglutathione lyase family enzyme